MNIKEMIERAKEAGACEDGIEWARQFDSVEEMLASDFNEETIDYLHWYSRDVIKGRWEEAESIILTGPQLAYLYAKDIIKGRWREAEPVISTYLYKEYYEDHFNCKLVDQLF